MNRESRRAYYVAVQRSHYEADDAPQDVIRCIHSVDRHPMRLRARGGSLRSDNWELQEYEDHFTRFVV
jgi:hypothetical protein